MCSYWKSSSVEKHKGTLKSGVFTETRKMGLRLPYRRRRRADFNRTMLKEEVVPREVGGVALPDWQPVTRISFCVPLPPCLVLYNHDILLLTHTPGPLNWLFLRLECSSPGPVCKEVT